MGMNTESVTMNTSPETRFTLIGRLGDVDDAQAWNEFAQIYQPLIFRIARKRGLQHADAAEVTQEVLTRVANAVADWDPDRSKGSFRGWLYRITRNATVDFLRQAARQPRNWQSLTGSPLADIQESSDASSREFQSEYQKQVFLWAAQRVQSEFQTHTWTAFWQSAVDGVAIKQIAGELRMTPGAIYVARSRVMKRLSEEVQKRNDDSMLDGPAEGVRS
jgi:RNA polymerase sigma-70 factor (ECF subfamily)